MAMKKESLWRRWLRGMLDRMRENTDGGDDELRALMRKLDDGELRWTGRPLFAMPPKSSRR